MLTPLRVIAARVGAFFRGAELDRDFELELESHIALLADDNVRRGMTVETARREARLALGSLEATKELHRAARGLPALAALLQDLRYAARTLRRDAGLAVFAILTLGLGIGASATVFSTVDALLLRPLPFRDPGRLAWVANSGGEGSPVTTIQVGHFVDLRQQSRSFADLAAFNAFHGVGKQKLTGDGLPERLSGVQVTQNFFSLLGVAPRLGRTFTAEECEARWRAPQAVLLSDGLWRLRFAADPGIVGRKITLNEAAVTVVGVLPASFDLAAVLEPGNPLDLYLPLPLTEETNRQGNLLAVVGRLKPGATVDSAQEELGILGRRLTEEHPERNGVAPRLTPLAEHVSGRFRPSLSVLAVAVFVVMLIVCANLSNLLLARMPARQREMAVRAALGAGRGRLIRQLLTESLVLSGCGALLGVGLAVAGTSALAHLEAFHLPLLTSVRVDLPALGFILLLAVLSGLLFGVLPALQAPAVPLHDALKDGGRGSSGSAARARLRGALVVSEIALACVLLVATGLLLHSMLRLLDVDLGYRPERTAVLRVDPGARYSTRPLRNTYYDEVIRRVSSLPGIEAAGLTDVLPLGGDRTWGVAGSGEVYVKDKGRDTFVRVVSDGYLRAVGIPLRAGRDFTARDTPAGEPVALINETLARTLWPGEDAIGRMVTLFEGRRRVVGVVGDVRHSALEQEAGNEIYLPIRQTDDYSAVHLVVRTALSPGALASSVRRELQPIEPSLTSGDLRALERLVSQALSPRRFVALLLAGFSAFALALAALGVYAVISYGVGQRTRELGIRAALGASGHDLKTLILAETLSLAGLGMLLGALASWILARALKGLLFEITTTDPATFGGMLVLLAAAATLAGYLPARRAARIDPNSALRGG